MTLPYSSGNFRTEFVLGLIALDLRKFPELTTSSACECRSVLGFHKKPWKPKTLPKSLTDDRVVKLP